MTETSGTDPSGMGGQDFDVIGEAEAILAGAEPAAPPRAEPSPDVVTVEPTAVHEAEVRAERQNDVQGNLHTVWSQADAMAHAWNPDTRLLYSGVTTEMKMARTLDLYQTPEGGFLAYMGRFLPGTGEAAAVPCQIVGFRHSKETPGDYEIKMTNPLLFDTNGRPIEFIMRVATELPRAQAEGRPDGSLLRYKRRTNLQAIRTNETGRRIGEDLRMTDLHMIEARDIQIQLGEDPPYRKGLLNVGSADRK